MDEIDPTQIRSDAHAVLTAQARAAAGSTAVAALMLLYFGFNSLEPSRNDLGDWSLWILYYTLRFGGLACAILTIVLFLGFSAALVADAIVSTLIGVLLILTGTGLAVGGGTIMQAAINVVCGFMFASYGIRTGMQFVAIRRRTLFAGTPADLNRVDSREANFDRPSPTRPVAIQEADTATNSIDALRAQKSARQSIVPANSTEGDVKPASKPTEDGFLAALSKNKPRNGDSHGAA